MVKDEEASERYSPWRRYMKDMVSFVCHTEETFIVLVASKRLLFVFASFTSRPGCHVVTS